MWRDGEITTTNFSKMVLEGLKSEELITIVSGLGNDVISAVEHNSNPKLRAALREEIATGLLGIVQGAKPESDIQLQLARIFAALARTPEHIQFIRTMLDGGLAGLKVDRDLRWYFVNILVDRNAFTQKELDAVLAEDKTLTGETSYAQAIASFPTKEAKASTWKSLLNDDLSSYKRLALHRGFMRIGQEELLKDYVDPYFDSLLDMWNSSSYEVSSSNVEMLYPRYIITQEVLDKTDAWLGGVGKGAPDTLRRLVSEGRDSLARALRVQQKDI
jgi:aminopeptidase N